MRAYRSRFVNVGDTINKWNEIKTEMNLLNDRYVAKFLIKW